MYLKKDKFLIVGISKSGYAACNALLTIGASCYIYDDSAAENSRGLIDELTERGASLISREEIKNIIDKIDVVVLSPGVPIDHDIPVTAKRLKKNVIGELELGYTLSKGTTVAITGTNGKTTTCSLVDSILRIAGLNSFLVGNVGDPLCANAFEIGYGDIAVTEVSSYQLETVSTFKPHIACILNISPDHLSRHYNMENYIYLKSRILANLRESEYAVLNYDDITVREMKSKTRGKCIFFSLTEKTDGAYVLNNQIFWKGEMLAPCDGLALRGGHNLQNVLAAVCVCKILGVDNEHVRSGLVSFQGVKHRMQTVCEVDGVKYVNDSKATNPDSALKGAQGISGEMVMLIGGKDKGVGYEKLFDELLKIKEVKSIILFGGSREKLYRIAAERGHLNVNVCVDMKSAVKLSRIIASPGQTVLLSPACASFDEYACFEERGDAFIETVKDFQSAKGNG